MNPPSPRRLRLRLRPCHLHAAILALLACSVYTTFWLTGLVVGQYAGDDGDGPSGVGDYGLSPTGQVRVFVSYAYCEEGKRKGSVKNLDFFLRHGARVPDDRSRIHVDYGLTVNGRCGNDRCRDPGAFVQPNRMGHRPRFVVLERENAGYDFGAHAAMLRHLEVRGGTLVTDSYDAFVFLNDGVAGPILPKYAPRGWHWSEAFVDPMREGAGFVGTCIMCLPKRDAGGAGPKVAAHGAGGGGGPKVEGFAFAISGPSLALVRTKGTSFEERGSKRTAIPSGEYHLTSSLERNGVRIDPLLAAYKGVDWSDAKEWGCNNGLHPGRNSTYFRTSVDPMKVVFHEAAGRCYRTY